MPPCASDALAVGSLASVHAYIYMHLSLSVCVHGHIYTYMHAHIFIHACTHNLYMLAHITYVCMFTRSNEYLSVKFCHFVCLRLSGFVSLSLSLSVCLSVSVCLSACPSVCMHDCMCAMYVCMYVCMYACMFVCMYVCMYVYRVAHPVSESESHDVKEHAIFSETKCSDVSFGTATNSLLSISNLAWSVVLSILYYF